LPGGLERPWEWAGGMRRCLDRCGIRARVAGKGGEGGGGGQERDVQS